ncbi:MAG: VWA-like domain-containing protein [Patescibacteria group bacterium]|nr:VWA-like domain-containing protein [Patescibacteria group bacterium]
MQKQLEALNTKMTDLSYENFKKGVVLFKLATDSKATNELIRMAKENKVHLILHLPFFKGLIGGLELHPTYEIETYGADYRRWYFNPNWSVEQSDRQLRGDMLHSVIHLIFQHVRRKGERFMPIWELATELSADLLSNQTLDDLQKKHLLSRLQMDIHDISYIDSQFHNMSTENIYEELNQQFQKAMGQAQSKMNTYQEQLQQKGDQAMEQMKGDHQSSCQCSLGEVLDKFQEEVDEDMENLEKQRYENKVQDEVRKNRHRGTVPGQIERLVDLLEEDPKIDWRQMLLYYIQTVVIYDVSWKRLNKAMLANDIYMPAIEKSNLEIVVALDTSGSIGDDEMSEFVVEVSDILNSLANVKMILIDCDAQIQNVEVIEYGEAAIWSPANKRRHGYGGTRFEPVFEWIDQSTIIGELDQPELLIYFTDAEGSYPKTEPEYKTVWIVNNEHYNQDQIPFGEIISYF